MSSNSVYNQQVKDYFLQHSREWTKQPLIQGCYIAASKESRDALLQRPKPKNLSKGSKLVIVLCVDDMQNKVVTDLKKKIENDGIQVELEASETPTVVSICFLNSLRYSVVRLG